MQTPLVYLHLILLSSLLAFHTYLSGRTLSPGTLLVEIGHKQSKTENEIEGKGKITELPCLIFSLVMVGACIT